MKTFRVIGVNPDFEEVFNSSYRAITETSALERAKVDAGLKCVAFEIQEYTITCLTKIKEK